MGGRLSGWRGFKRAEQAPSPETLTVRDVLEAYHQDYIFRGCRSTKTLKCEIGKLNEAFGDLAAGALRLPMIREYQIKCKAEGLANATINHRVAVLKAAFHHASQYERIETMPTFPKRLRPAKPRQGYFDFADYEAVREALPRWGADVLDFGFYSGWRKSEILGLTWKEVDLREECIRLDPDRSKNYEARAPLPLLGFGLDVIQRREMERAPWLDRVFHYDGRRISMTTWHNTWKEARTAAGLPHLLFHDLRRTVVMNLERARVPRGTAMSWVGHKTQEMYSRYAITAQKDMTDAADRLLDVVNGGNGEPSEKPAQAEAPKRSAPIDAEDDLYS